MITFGELRKMEGRKIAFVTDDTSFYVGTMSNIQKPAGEGGDVVALVTFDYTGFLDHAIVYGSRDGRAFADVVHDYKAIGYRREGFPIRETNCFLDIDELTKLSGKNKK